MSGTEPTAPPPPRDAAEDLDEATYATRLEEAFIAERGTPFLLSAKDWQLIRGWRERGIPADTAIRAVRETFEKRSARGAAGKISSIAYCANAVEERWELERRGLVGRGDALRDLEPEGVLPRLTRVLAALEEAVASEPAGLDLAAYRKAVAMAADKVRSLPPERGFDGLEEDLSQIEKSLLRKLEKALTEDALASLERGVCEALGDTRGLSTEVLERTRRALRRRELRRMLALPALTLFDV